MPTPTDAPTLVGVGDLRTPSPASEPGPSSSTRQPVHVGFSPRFEDETASLLRQRLTAASVATVAAFTFCLSLTAAVSVPVPELRASLLAVTALCLILLRSPIPLSLRRLRLIELAAPK